MAFDNIYVKGATSVIIQIMLRDSTTGMGKTGVTYSALSAAYCRAGSTGVTINAAAGAPGDAYSSGKFAEINSSLMPGLYQLHLPDEALATGANSVEIAIKNTGVLDKSTKIVLVDANLRDAVHLGITSLPNAAAGASGGLPLSADANGRVDLLKIKGVTVSAESAQIGANIVSVGAAALAQIQNGLATTANQTTLLNAIITIDNVVDSIKVDTDPLPADPASESTVIAVGSAVVTAINAIASVDTVVIATKATVDDLAANGVIAKQIKVNALQSIDNQLSGTHGTGAWDAMATSVQVASILPAALQSIDNALSGLDVNMIEIRGSSLQAQILSDALVKVGIAETPMIQADVRAVVGLSSVPPLMALSFESVSEYEARVKSRVVAIDIAPIQSIDTELSLQHGSGSWDAVGSGAVTSISIDALTSIDSQLQPRFDAIQSIDTAIAAYVATILSEVTSIYAAIPSDLGTLIRFIKDCVSAGMHNGVIRFVDKATGSNANTGTGWLDPYATLAYAIADVDAVGGGGFIFLKHGPYDEEVTVSKYICIVGVKDNSSFIEVTGPASGSTGPTVTLEENSGMTGIRIGKQNDDGGSGCVLKMKSGTRFWDSSIGDIAEIIDYAIKFDTGAVEVEVKDNTIDGCNKAVRAFGGTTDNSDIKGNKTCRFREDVIDFSGADNDIADNRFLGVASGFNVIASYAALSNSNISNNLWSGDGGFIPTTNALSNCNNKNNEQWATAEDAEVLSTGVTVLAISAGPLTSIDTALAPRFNAIQSIDTAILADTTFLQKIASNKQEFVKVGSDWFLKVYDDDDITELLIMKVEKYGGGAIDDLTGTGTPSIRNRTTT